ncbi:MAG: YceI family protein [Dehalococcoidia bacterium]
MKNRFLLGGALAAVAAVAVAAGVWYFLIRSDAPEAVSLEAALEAAQTAGTSPNATSNNSAASTPTTSGSPSSNDGTPASLAGTWNLVAGGTSFAGYRVQEELAGIGSTTAVGRTTAVTGSLQYDGSQVTSVEVTADMTKLASDRSMRDGQLRNQGIEYAKYPTSTFKLTSPIAISSVPAAGQSVKQTIKGDLTLHGVTKAITMDVEGVLKDGRLVVVGSTVIQFSDYNISKPQGASVLSIADNGTMELQLIFQHA